VRHVLFTGGGTAGHVIPAIPVMTRLLNEGIEISFVGSDSGLEEQLLQDVAVNYHAIAAGKLRRYFSLENLFDVFRVARGCLQAAFLIRRVRPDVVFSKGGFVSFPVVLAAWLWRVPVVAHESDLTPGLANRLALPFIRTLCVNFAGSERHLQDSRFTGEVLLTGTPVREALTGGDAERGRRLLGFAGNKPLLVVTGGSLGADAINQTVRDALSELLVRCDVVHVCGTGKTLEMQRDGYRQFEFVADTWGDILAAADLVISRAGANSLYELFLLGKPNLLIPLSAKVSRGDQVENARYACSLGYSRVLDEEALAPSTLLATVTEMLDELPALRAKLEDFQPLDSVTLIAEAIRKAAS
jgi:UDP-N-acetylglucosamine--N-acetylmuramyl-(pentapeptide) pyrophosphoryl-undecaprenol N-acetylglucosamine transferase